MNFSTKAPITGVAGGKCMKDAISACKELTQVLLSDAVERFKPESAIKDINNHEYL